MTIAAPFPCGRTDPMAFRLRRDAETSVIGYAAAVEGTSE